MTALDDPGQFLIDLYRAAVDAVSADRCLPHFLPEPPEEGRTVVVGAGKAAASMAKTLEEHWPGPLTGLVITRYGHAEPTEYIEVVQASHPIPDEAGLDATLRILELVHGLDEKDLVICLLSGGGSALLTLPAAGMSFEQKQDISRALLTRGATIAEINCVRKHLSQIKGGRLALACAPARVVTLMISDVPGDEAHLIASGPTLPDPTTCEQALAVLKTYRTEVPDNVLEHLRSGFWETPKPGDPRFEGNESHIVAKAADALLAAENVARSAGITPWTLSDSLEGATRNIARLHADIVRDVLVNQTPFESPGVILSGGEATVNVKGFGKGGRNTEFLLALAIALEGIPDVYAIACDTDGIDGLGDNAGAVCFPDTLGRARERGLDARACLKNNNSYHFFSALDDLVITHPTRTNVSDFRAILISR